ncbi:MAG: putative sugar O-methyltransferase [Pseudomonadales bacterium]|nr:putative sugar O-methyltransferase [Pseudomonadales bacterium]
MLVEQSRFEAYKEWIDLNDAAVTYSDIWQECKSTFSSSDSGLRGYGNNRQKDYHSLARNVRLVNLTFGRLKYLLDVINRGVNAALSLVLSGDKTSYRKYGLHYEVDIEGLFKELNPECYAEYAKVVQNLGEFYSYSSLRTFYYFYLSKQFLPEVSAPNIIEIGAGMGNFAAHVVRSYDSVSYYIVDIPEIIPSALLELSQSGGLDGVSFFLPHEFEAFTSCISPKKIIWLVPAQIKLIQNLAFDFAVNTESFAEMLPHVSQDYINFIDKNLAEGACFFGINRAVRMVTKNFSSYEGMTTPFKYSFPSCENIMTKIDEFRALVPRFQQEPNLITVWKK